MLFFGDDLANHKIAQISTRKYEGQDIKCKHITDILYVLPSYCVNLVVFLPQIRYKLLNLSTNTHQKNVRSTHIGNSGYDHSLLLNSGSRIRHDFALYAESFLIRFQIVLMRSSRIFP